MQRSVASGCLCVVHSDLGLWQGEFVLHLPSLIVLIIKSLHTGKRLGNGHVFFNVKILAACRKNG